MRFLVELSCFFILNSSFPNNNSSSAHAFMVSTSVATTNDPRLNLGRVIFCHYTKGALFSIIISSYKYKDQQSVLPNKEWYTDSAASCHMSCHQSWFSEFQDSDSSVILGDDSVVQATGIGTIIMEMHLPDGTLRCTLTDVLYVLTLKKNLFSISKATQSGTMVSIDSTQCVIWNLHTGQLLL